MFEQNDNYSVYKLKLVDVYAAIGADAQISKEDIAKQGSPIRAQITKRIQDQYPNLNPQRCTAMADYLLALKVFADEPAKPSPADMQRIYEYLIHEQAYANLPYPIMLQVRLRLETIEGIEPLVTDDFEATPNQLLSQLSEAVRVSLHIDGEGKVICPQKYEGHKKKMNSIMEHVGNEVSVVRQALLADIAKMSPGTDHYYNEALADVMIAYQGLALKYAFMKEHRGVKLEITDEFHINTAVTRVRQACEKSGKLGFAYNSELNHVAARLQENMRQDNEEVNAADVAARCGRYVPSN